MRRTMTLTLFVRKIFRKTSEIHERNLSNFHIRNIEFSSKTYIDKGTNKTSRSKQDKKLHK
jgi:hypothetical protein